MVKGGRLWSSFAVACCLAAIALVIWKYGFPDSNIFCLQRPASTRVIPTSIHGHDRFRWYGHNVYPVIKDDDQAWQWIGTFLRDVRDRQQKNLVEGFKILQAHFMASSKRDALSLRYPLTSPSFLEDLLLKSETVSARLQIGNRTREPCRDAACQDFFGDYSDIDNLDLVLYNANVADLYDMGQLISKLSCVKYIVTSITTESGDQLINERYTTILYDFLNKLYFNHDYIPVATEIDESKWQRFDQQFWIIWKKWDPTKTLDYFPPAGDGSPSFELQRLAAFFNSPLEDQCNRREGFGGSFTGERLNQMDDGRYIACMDRMPEQVPEKCLVYSFGIRGDFSFDDALRDFGCSVFSFDPSMGEKSHKRAEHHFFNDWGLKADTKVVQPSWQLYELEDIRQRLNHSERTVNVVKMDAEGAEMYLLLSARLPETLKHLDQIMMEIHYSPDFFTWNGAMTVRDLSRGMHALEKHGFAMFYSRPAPAYKGAPAYWGPDLRAYDRSFAPDGTHVIIYEVSFVKRHRPCSEKCFLDRT